MFSTIEDEIVDVYLDRETRKFNCYSNESVKSWPDCYAFLFCTVITTQWNWFAKSSKCSGNAKNTFPTTNHRRKTCQQFGCLKMTENMKIR